ncbi:MAG: cupin domain-containing protein [Burkholderiales bacterium]|nr:cupin domain-containing protein [Burkholderiales bacterium]
MKPTDNERALKPSGVFFRRGASVPDLMITAIEGVIEEPGKLTIKPLLVGNDMLFLQAFKAKGMQDPVHQHDDHESIAYLVSGRMRLVIGGEEFIAEAGDAWMHPRGVPHFSEALEDCIQVEVKSPPRKTWA